MRKLGVLISKGGVGKSTTAVNLAAGLARVNKKVLLIDADTQGQAGYMLGIRDATHGLKEFILDGISFKSAIKEARENLYLLAGGTGIATLKLDIGKRPFRAEFTLSDALQGYDKDFDFVIIDSGPGWDQLAVNILFYVTELIAPVSVEVVSLASLMQFQEMIEPIRQYNSSLEMRYLLPTFVDGRVRKSAEILEQLKKYYQAIICDPIKYCVRLSEAPGFGQVIFEYAPRSTGAIDYNNLVERILKNGR